jgi:uncharacterized protein (UPF0335 family)
MKKLIEKIERLEKVIYDLKEDLLILKKEIKCLKK